MMREVTIEERAGMAVLNGACAHLQSGKMMDIIAFWLLRALFQEIKLGGPVVNPFFDYRKYLIEGE